MKKIVPAVEKLDTAFSPADLFGAIRDYPYPFFLDSSGPSGGSLSRFSFLGCDPFLVFKSKDDTITLRWQDGRVETFRSGPFAALKELLKKYSTVSRDGHLPFTCGAVGYFSYDLKNFTEELPDNAADDLGIPDCMLGFYDTAIICDNLNRTAYIASSGLPEAAGSQRNMRRRIERLEEFRSRLTPLSARPVPVFAAAPEFSVRSNFSKDSYIKTIEKAKRYIRKGDIYQVNLSQRFETELRIEPFDLYARLRRYSPAPFSSYLDFKDVVIASSSPERFLLKRGSYIETRPIKGTRPRGKDGARDLTLERELISSRKDRAEHIMIVDLERNDLGRICEYGSVRLSESLVLERYANVFHLVSTVSGKLREGLDQIDCLLATFPGGSITGAPKIRSMEIIDELEGVKRSVYTGAVGYLAFSGDMDTSIVIRTFIVKGRRVYFQAGGGIVADSDPEKEYEETLDKAKGLMQALGAAPANRSKRNAELLTV